MNTDYYFSFLSICANLRSSAVSIVLDMNKIRILAEAVANRIAAGEVIERPASVVKEPPGVVATPRWNE